jgi:flagellar basal body rod protein FlgB
LPSKTPLTRALDAGGIDSTQEIKPDIYTPLTTPTDPDGNDVASDREVSALAKNQMLYNAYIQVARGKLRLINTAISSAPGG